MLLETGGKRLGVKAPSRDFRGKRSYNDEIDVDAAGVKPRSHGAAEQERDLWQGFSIPFFGAIGDSFELARLGAM